MKSILPQTAIIKLVLLKTNYSSEKQYRMNKYVVSLEYEGQILLFNTLTRELISLDKEEYNGIYSNYDVSKALIEKYFLVDSTFDEKIVSQQISSLANALSNKKSITHYTVFPTMACNARCFYCFEHGAKRHSMSEQVAKDSADYIIKKSEGKDVSIQWFGGEPLCNIKAIDIISSRLKENNITFKSRMITNGYLLDYKMLDHAVENWNLNHVQITLDGTREVYNKIKNYVYKPNNDAFDKVINNIGFALAKGLSVYIRINLHKDNCDDINELTAFLCDKFKGYESKLSIYCWLLYDNRGIVKAEKNITERKLLTDRLLEIEEKIYKLGFALKNTPKKNIVTTMCIADSDRSITILPDGNIGKCDHFSDERFIGDIYSNDYSSDMISFFKQRKQEVELCDFCPLYPQCVNLKNCPDASVDVCDEIEQNRLLHTLYNQMRNAYNKKTKECEI